MSLPPMILDVSIAPRDGRRRRLWLPLFLLWPLVLALAETRGTAISFSTATSAVDVTVT